MKLLLVLLLVATCSAQNFTQLTSEILSAYCPYRDLYGLSPECNGTKIVGQNINSLPVLIGGGWDPVKGQIRLPFLNMTYYNNNTYISNSGVVYNVPDQVTLVKKNLTIGNVESYLFEKIDDFLGVVNLNRTTVTSGLLGLPVESLQYFITYFDSGNNNIVVSYDYRTAYELSIDLNNISLIPEVQLAIDSLPDTYDPVTYGEFIEYWGTDITISGNSGGLAQQSVIIKSCFGGLDTQDQALLYLLKNTQAYEYQNVNFEAGFTEYSAAQTIDIYGGNPVYIQMSQWNQRVQSFDDYPVLTQVVVIPLTNFIVDPNKKKAMQIAVADYLANETNSRTQISEAWYKELLGPKTIFYGSASAGNPGSNYPNQWVLLYPSMIASSQISANGTANFPGYDFLSEVASPGSCGRNSDGYVYSIWTDKGSYAGVYGVDKVSVSIGTPVRSGCSTSTAELYYPGTGTAYYYWWQQIYCCYGCIMTALPPAYEVCISGDCVTYPNTGLISCACPSF